MIYPIIAYGDPVLKKKCAEVEKDKVDIKKLVSDMFETMNESSGVGLAAPQIGLSYPLFIMDAQHIDSKKWKGYKRVFINPEIIKISGKPWTYEEGCLSIPRIREDVDRPETVVIKYFDEEWVEHTETFNDIPARIIQHEFDHIEGILFIDYLTPFKKRILKGKLRKISIGNVDVDYKMKFPK